MPSHVNDYYMNCSQEDWRRGVEERLHVLAQVCEMLRSAVDIALVTMPESGDQATRTHLQHIRRRVQTAGIVSEQLQVRFLGD